MLAALAAVNRSDARRLYDRLRVAYNTSRPPELRPVPALEDWQGIPPLCEDFLCRCVGANLIANLSIFSGEGAHGKNQADRGGFHQYRILEKTVLFVRQARRNL